MSLLELGVYTAGYLASTPFMLRPAMSIRTVKKRCHGEERSKSLNPRRWAFESYCREWHKETCWRREPKVRNGKDAAIAAVLALAWPLTLPTVGVLAFTLKVAPKTADEREADLAAREARIAELERQLL